MFLSTLVVSCCHVKKNTATEVTIEERSVVNDHLIVKLKAGVSTDTLIESYKKYNLKLDKVLVKDQNMWLFVFDESKISAQALVEELRKDPLVENAERNKKLKLR